jgi:pimeloyl-[acyl-carrier protein] methyl ester esterase
MAAADWTPGCRPRKADRSSMIQKEFERFEAYCRDDSADTVRRFRSRVADGGPNPSAVMLVLEQAAVAGHQALLAGLSILADTDEVAALADLEVPTLWVGGGRDRVVDHEAVSTAAGRHASGQLLALANASHAPHLDHPQLLAEKVGDWLAGEVVA